MKSLSLILLTVACATFSATAFADDAGVPDQETHESIEAHAARKGVKVGHSEIRKEAITETPKDARAPQLRFRAVKVKSPASAALFAAKLQKIGKIQIVKAKQVKKGGAQ